MSKKEERGKTVQLLAVNPKYKERVGFVVPVYNSTSKKYECGVEHLPAIEQGKILKALGVSEDPDKGVQIDELQIPISHRQKLNLSVDEDYGIYCLCMVNETIARSSKVVDVKRHLFFINDVEAEAVADISQKMLEYKATQFVINEADLPKLKSLCIYLGGIEVRNLSLNALMAKVFKEAERRPKDIIEFYEGKVENKVFILELYHHGIIQIRQGKYYDGEVYMGTLQESIDYILNPKNLSHVNSLGTRLLEKKG